MDFDPYAFLLAGGHITMSEWAVMPDEFQAVFIDAGRRLMDERAASIASANLTIQLEAAGEAKMFHDIASAADRIQASQETGT